MTPRPAAANRLRCLVSVLLLTAGGFALIAMAVSAGWCHVFDTSLSAGAQNLRSQPLDAVMLSITLMGDGVVITVITMACVGWLLTRRCWRLAATFAFAMLLVAWGVPLLKIWMSVPRPHDFYTGRQAFSFPSGHATSAAALWSMLAWLVCSAGRGGMRVLVICAATLLIGSVALSRVVLAAHWPSDVLGGVLLGVSLASLFALSIRQIKLPAARPLILALVAVLIWLGVGGCFAAARYSEAEAFYRIHAAGSPGSHGQPTFNLSMRR